MYKQFHYKVPIKHSCYRKVSEQGSYNSRPTYVGRNQIAGYDAVNTLFATAGFPILTSSGSTQLKYIEYTGCDSIICSATNRPSSWVRAAQWWFEVYVGVEGKCLTP